jgi:hypothetical protein
MSVFISYRRDGGKQAAQEIYDALQNDYQVFLDTESLKNGRFDEAIAREIESCSDFILIVTQTVFDRCAEPDDWILAESRIALANKKNVIPVFVGITSFPENVPGEIGEIRFYNAVFWENASSCKKIEEFLTDDKRYALTVLRTGSSVGLEEESKELLKELYRGFLTKKSRSVRIRFDIREERDPFFAEISGEPGQRAEILRAAAAQEQYYRRRKQRVADALERAAEYVLRDEKLDAYASQFLNRYMREYGDSCFFFNEDGAPGNYAVPFLWTEIIEEMLKELVMDRNNVYGSRTGTVSMDCFLRVHGNDLWYFLSVATPIEDEGAFSAFSERLQNSIYYDPVGYYDIPPEVMASRVFPDFYYNLGLLRTGRSLVPFDKLKDYPELFDLTAYRFGVH